MQCDCGSADTVWDYVRGEMCCAGCGAVLGDRIEAGAGHGADADQSSWARHTMIPRAPDSGRLRACDAWAADHAKASAMRGGSLARMRAMWDKLGLPESVYRGAADIYAATAKRGFRGRTLASVMAASMYVACRESGVPRSIRDIIGVSNLSRKDLSRSIRFIMRVRGQPKPYDLPVLVAGLANRLQVSVACEREAVRVAAGLDWEFTAGKNPLVLAASTICVAGKSVGEGCTGEMAADAAGVCPASVGKRVREIADRR